MSVIITDRGAVWTGDSGLSHFDGSLSCLGPGAFGRQFEHRLANMDDAFLRGLDAEVQMVPLCGASKARPAVKMALVVVVGGGWCLGKE